VRVELRTGATPPIDKLVRRASRAKASAHAAAYRTGRYLYYAGVATVGVLVARIGGGPPVSDALFALALAAVAVEALARREMPLKRVPPLLIAAAGCALVAGAVVYVGRGHNVGAVSLRLVFVEVVLVWLSAAVLRTTAQVATATMFWVASAAASGVAALLQLVVSGDIIPGTTASWGRMTGLTQHVNDVGGVTSIALVPAVALALRAHGRLRVVALIAAVSVLTALALSASVGGMIAAAAAGATCVVVVQRQRARSLWRPLLLGLAAIVVVFAAVTAVARAADVRAISPLDRVETVVGITASQKSQVTTTVRIQSLKGAWFSIRSEPITGIGADPETTPTPWSGTLTHNIFLGSWFGIGIFGLLSVIVAVVAGSAIARDVTRGPADILGAALVGSCVASLVFATENPVLYARYCWLPVALLFAYLSRTRERSAAPVGWAASPAPTSTAASGRLRARPNLDLRPSMRGTLLAVVSFLAGLALAAVVFFAVRGGNETVTVTTPAKPTPRAAPENRTLAAVYVRRWAYFNCGPGCSVTRIKHVTGPFWYVVVKVPSGPVCYSLDIKNFRVRGGKTPTGFDPTACAL
jgi:O-antigen ligase